MPFLPIGKMGIKIGFSDCSEVGFKVFGQPLPVAVLNWNQLGVRLAVPFMGAAKIDSSADHSYARTKAQDISAVLRLIAADYRNATGHEFGEVVAGLAEHPQLRGRKARVALGHGHAARTDVSGDIDFALGHCVGDAVCGMPVYDDLRSAV